MSENNHIRTNTSPEREAHLRVLAQTDNAMRDAMAMLDEARAVAREGRARMERTEVAYVRVVESAKTLLQREMSLDKADEDEDLMDLAAAVDAVEPARG
jgi:hypothetical protein